ncbi:MAG: ribosome-recycling factor [Candidatus Wildermuthbacteria bacterium]|nr:ribosome-recycling factor [Candidatus Wildermuthbacteria bacterium]
MYKEEVQKVRPELEKALEFFKKEAAKIRTGSASPSLVEDISVDTFGQKMPLKQLAAISCPERKQILIQPWDKSYLEPIAKALQSGQLGASPVVEKDAIRITLPQMNQEYRQSFSKILSEKAEQARELMRKWRDQAWSEIQRQVREGKAGEDEKFKGKDELQKLIDEYQEKIESLTAIKEREIQEV